MQKIIHHHFDSLPSTHLWAKEHPIEGFTLITADQQTGGKGQFGRDWVSPPGNLYASFCFYVENGLPQIVHAAQLLSYSTAQVLIEMGFSPTFKWPNDILLSGKKVGGVLCETIINEKTLVIDSVGLNVNMGGVSNIDQPATSLSNEAGQAFEIGPITAALIKQFSADLQRFLHEGFKPFN